ncbi:MAG: class I SAM-dependent methyltransferase [Thermoplasmata archaeon]|nr:MAG: class I SAM-dependent methyltransferase [Thermoplasmata archaeon]
MVSRSIMVTQLRRQERWLRASREWILEEIVGGAKAIGTALDVGCGPGFSMEELSEKYNIRGVGMDVDRKMLLSAKVRDLETVQADAHFQPFKDGGFELVHCTFTLMWLSDPVAALKEMHRLSSQWVICFAEPDYGARVDHPAELEGLGGGIADSIIRDGGDPFCGRKLRKYFSEAGLAARIGVMDSVWSLEQLSAEFRDEWDFLRSSNAAPPDEIARLEGKAKEAMEEGTRLQFTPVFYAAAMV